MRRLLVVLLLALVFCSSAWAGSSTYVQSWGWSAGYGYGTSFSQSWWRDLMYKNANFDSTVAFIDNTSYGWHNTLRGPGSLLDIHWFSSDVKKAHCHSNVTVSAYAACTAYN